jgi:hypothetical protein
MTLLILEITDPGDSRAQRPRREDMPKVVVTAQVEDVAKWEQGFRTHRDLFRSESVSKPIDLGATDGNYVAVCIEPDDLDTFMKGMDSPATAEAMAFDGVKRETVKMFVLDKEFKV